MNRKTLGLAAAATALAIAAAPTAAATPAQDARFLSLITEHGISYGSADAAISQGKAVCRGLDSGYYWTPADAAQDVYAVLPITKEGAVWAVVAAVVAYCPWHAPTSTGGSYA